MFRHTVWITACVVIFASGSATAPSGAQVTPSLEKDPEDVSHADQPIASPIISMKHGDSARCLAFHSDGRLLATAGWTHDGIKIWDATSGDHLITLQGHTRPIASLAFSRDGRYLVSGSHDQTSRVWRLAKKDGETIRTFQVANLPGRPLSVMRSVAFSPDSQFLVSGSDDWKVRVWDVELGNVRNTWEHALMVTSVVFSRDGTLVASGSVDGVVKLTDWDKAHVRWQSRVPPGSVSLAFGPKGERMVVSSGQRDSTRLTVFDVASGTELMTQPIDVLAIVSATFTPSGRQIVTAGTDGFICVWDIETKELTHSFRAHAGPVYHAIFSPDGKQLATIGEDGFSKLWAVTW